MPVVILAGGKGTRLAEETILKPKPLVEIGSMPIVHHIMNIYAGHGCNDFILCLGYKGDLIKEYFMNLVYKTNSLEVKFGSKNFKIVGKKPYATDWTIKLIDTGDETMTGGRLKRVGDFIKNENFFMTYGDGLSNIPIMKQLNFFRHHKKQALISAVRPPARFGALEFSGQNGNLVKKFVEKPTGDNAWINGGFFILNKKILDIISGDSTVFEDEPLQKLAETEQLLAWRHEGFWHPMDTLKDKQTLEHLWRGENCPWLEINDRE